MAIPAEAKIAINELVSMPKMLMTIIVRIKKKVILNKLSKKVVSERSQLQSEEGDASRMVSQLKKDRRTYEKQLKEKNRHAGMSYFRPQDLYTCSSLSSIWASNSDKVISHLTICIV